jgi:hypothetical protein
MLIVSWLGTGTSTKNFRLKPIWIYFKEIHVIKLREKHVVFVRVSDIYSIFIVTLYKIFNWNVKMSKSSDLCCFSLSDRRPITVQLLFRLQNKLQLYLQHVRVKHVLNWKWVSKILSEATKLYVHDRSLSWLGTGTSTKNFRLKPIWIYFKEIHVIKLREKQTILIVLCFLLFIFLF